MFCVFFFSHNPIIKCERTRILRHRCSTPPIHLFFYKFICSLIWIFTPRHNWSILLNIYALLLNRIGNRNGNRNRNRCTCLNNGNFPSILLLHRKVLLFFFLLFVCFSFIIQLLIILLFNICSLFIQNINENSKKNKTRNRNGCICPQQR